MIGILYIENGMKNVIMKFTYNAVTHFQDTTTYKNVNQKLQPPKFKKYSKSKTLEFIIKKI